MDKEYVVTLYKKDDLEKFYGEMQLTNFPLVMKRPLSRNTHYMMTEDQAERLRQDSRVWGVEAVDSFELTRQALNNEPYPKSGTFWKDDTQPPANVNSGDLQWGHIHCAGDQAQRGKGQFGPISSGGTYESVPATVEIFNNGKNVDLVIVDDPVSYDSGEWESTAQPGLSRFVQYQWFDELNSIIGLYDDDFQTAPTGTITYGQNSATPQYHGIHVAGTAAGKHYGWANEANIYNIAVTDPWPSGQQIQALLIFDYLRAFHLNKPINPATGYRNPTVTNHSYGGIRKTDNDEALTLAGVSQIIWRGTTYNSGNPGPSGWTEVGIGADFGFRFGRSKYPSWSSAVAADVQDAIEDGIVIIGAAGNDNLLIAEVGDQDWDNRVTISGIGTIYYNRGAWPNSPDSGAINVGALSNQADFRRSTYTQFGPGIDVFAPGDNIISAYGNTGGLNDTKYPVGNYYYPIDGTSMASPQVCGVAAVLASGKERFTNADVRGYLDKTSIDGDMTFDLAGGGLGDNSCRQGSPNKYLHAVNPRASIGYTAEVKGQRTSGMTFPRVGLYHKPPVIPATIFSINVATSGASAYILTGEDRNGTFTNSFNKNLSVNQGDLLEFNVNANGHPFWIKTQASTGTGFVVDVNTTTNNGASVDIVTWNTSTIALGTYYYICQFHGGMVGSIVIS
jgi:plastocyanin